MIRKRAKEKQREKSRKELAKKRTEAYEKAFYAKDDEKFLAQREEFYKPKSSLGKFRLD
ncbi:MAG: hypothetical protein IKS92_08035 [Victivallales bacterium]|nr:hypothetical protein [Victivallales bacterium]MBR4370981.1 hypothetical protein [Victivallales bacterium]